MRILIFFSLLVPLAVSAQDGPCRHSEARALELDLAGISSVRFELGPHELRLEGRTGRAGEVRGRACASKADYLQRLTLSQERQGDRLIVRAEREGRYGGSLFRRDYARLYLTGGVPDDLPIEVAVGSGDAVIAGVASLEVSVGSGDADVRRIPGPVRATVGSGDIEIRGVSELRVTAIGSGDIEARDVHGRVTVGSIGSGDFELQDAGGDVEIGSIGSGDAKLRNIGGSVVIDSLGSGDIKVHDVQGDLRVRTKGSGSIRHTGVAGTVEVPTKR